MVASAGTAVSSATSWAAKARRHRPVGASAAPSTSCVCGCRNASCGRDSSVRRAGRSVRPASAVTRGLAHAEVATAAVNSSSLSTVVEHHREPTREVVRRAHDALLRRASSAARGHRLRAQLRIEFKAIQVMRTAGAPVCSWSGA